MSSSVTRATGNEPPQSADGPRAEAADSPATTAPAAQRRGYGLLRAGLAALSGVLLYLSFPPRPLWWLAPFALALLAGCLHGRRARAGFGLGLLSGLGFLLPLLSWTGEEVGPVPWLALSTLEAVLIGLTGLGIALVSRLPAWPLFAAAVWVAGEALRARAPFGGFPWGKLAFGQADGVFTPLVALGGTPLLSFGVALCGFGLYEALRIARNHPGRTTAALTALTIAAPIGAGLAARPLVSDAAEDGTVVAAVIQGNVPRLGLDFNSQRRAVLDNHAKRTVQLAEDVRAGRAPKPDFVVWPENSSDLDPYAEPDAHDVIDRAVKAIGVPVAIGAVVAPETGPLRNTMILWDPVKGPTVTYDKRKIQPFGERIPMRSVVRLFSSDVDRVRRDFGPGKDPGVFDMAGSGVGMVTCFEAAFDDAVRSTVQDGAQVIAVPSNNATFGRTQMTYQQLAMDRIRAVEHSRTVLVPVTSGVSAVIRPDGRVVSQTKMFTADALVAEIPLRSGHTPATVLGPLPEYALLLLAAGGFGRLLARRIGSRRAA
ncbi:apolipoprotein N-acyltransferase [Streptomyces avidinii]|uniref:Apolipoprotein N-acyltransferase n=1 Tax=Streptomyces avidinii TaxID=1895 RepID=A0ABS4L4B9_STRAV|nr:apolipoprotein N-acyltransferase [Streptomyces avidinii]MBP2036942.1 apolipoprotein N-acyltransferase [Streptomyces avidinii]GGY94067.1 apolipoprotein N-acyltransferase [Streptomyces avidinii]